MMAFFFALREDFAVSKCSLTAKRSCWASFLSSASDSGENGPRQRCRIRSHSSSIRGSLEEGIAIFVGDVIE
jgi:hypothetical protein